MEVPSTMAMQIVCFVVSLVVATSLAAECPGAVGNDWVVASGRCYRYVNRAMTWKAAQKYCSTLGFASSLAVLDSDFARQKARETVKDNIKVPDWLWTGITAEGNDGRKWKTVDGNNVNNLNWRKNEPNNSGGKENYVGINGKEWNMNDATGSSKYPFICQAKPQSIDLLDELKCPIGWQRYNQLCLKYIDSKLNWYDAQERCSALGQDGSLAFVSSEADNNKVFDVAGTGGDYWIGISDLRHEKVWSDPFGKRISFSKWKPNEPNDLNGEDCVHVLSDRQWNDLECTDKRPFVCQISAEFSLNRCPAGNGWVQSGDMCYRYFRKSGTWSEALTECRKQGPGGTLPFINSHARNNEVYEAAAKSAGGEYSDNFKNFWIGVTDQGHSKTWTGAGDVGLLGNVNVWAKNEPNDHGGREEFVEMYVGSKKWNDEHGDEDAFICQIPAQPEPQCECPLCEIHACPLCAPCPDIACPAIEPCPACPEPEKCDPCPPCPVLSCPAPPPCPHIDCACPICFPPEPKCDKFWTEFQGSCYLFNGKKLSQQKAKEQCESQGANLLMVNMGENGNDKFLKEYIGLLSGSNKSKKNMIWVDMDDKDEEGVFMQGGNVFEGEVDAQKQSKKKDCVVYKRGVLSHDKCGAKRMFVCMKELPIILF